MPETIVFAIALMLALFCLGLIALFCWLARPWLRAFLHGAPVPLMQITAMRLRGNRPMLLIDAYIALRRSGVPVTIGHVEQYYIDARNRVFTSEDLVELVKQEGVWRDRIDRI
jgi:uncharacterized protein YqfA (UPF0365 family)